MNKVIIGKGKLDGKGIFADNDFKKGDIVIKYNLKSLSEEEFKKLSTKEKHLVV